MANKGLNDLIQKFTILHLPQAEFPCIFLNMSEIHPIHSNYLLKYAPKAPFIS